MLSKFSGTKIGVNLENYELFEWSGSRCFTAFHLHDKWYFGSVRSCLYIEQQTDFICMKYD